MKQLRFALLPLLLTSFFYADSLPGFEPLPAPVSNNAVAGVKAGRRYYVVSLMGLGAKKTWDDVTDATYSLDSDTQSWSKGRPVPGTAGRIAAAAAGVNGQIVLFGGAVVDAQGREAIVPDVNVYDPEGDHWSRGADLPVPVADAVVGVYRDRFVYLLGGRSNHGPVTNVQVYDAEKDHWQQGTPLPHAVFGHAGALVGDVIVYVDGARIDPAGTPPYAVSEECWMGKIAHKDPSKIEWSKIASHPGSAHFRMAAGGSDKDKKVYFFGGSIVPYLENGQGYNGKPAPPSSEAFDFNLHASRWEMISENDGQPRMDTHVLIVTPEGLLVVGGMESGQKVTATVSLIPKEIKTK
jgi:N-acetylneuraminic acid mutarotase